MAVSKKKPMHRVLTETFHKYITEGHWPPGFFLPTERDLCEGFSASRTTIRKSLEHLIQEGLIARKAGKGTWVLEPQDETDVWRITGSNIEYPFPDLLRIRILSTATVIADPSDPKLAEFTENEILTRIELLRVLHETPLTLSYLFMPEADANLVLEALERDAEIYLFRILERVSGRRAIEIKDDILAVIAARDVAEKLDISPGAPLLFLNKRIITDTDGRIMLTSQVYIRSDLQKFSIYRTREHKRVQSNQRNG